MMSMSLEEVPSMENSYCGGLNLKATELRLGLPGSESPERDNGNLELSIRSSLVSGGKRDFSVAIHGGSGSGKNWVFSNGAGSGKAIDGSGSRSDSVGKVVQEKKKKNQVGGANGHGVSAPASKAQVVGWPPIRSFRKNTMASNTPKNEDDDAEAKLGSGCMYIKVSMDGAPYLRKVDLKTYGSYNELSSVLGKIFGCFIIGQRGSDGVPSRDGLSESRAMDLVHGSEYAVTYEDKDGDWMLVGDVPWKMFIDTCRRLRIMKSSEATGLAPRTMEKCKDSSN